MNNTTAPRAKISALQFYLMLCLSRVCVSITINAQAVGGENFLENVFSSMLVSGVLFLFSLPLFALHRNNPTRSLPDVAEARMGRIGKGISTIYALYFLMMNVFVLSLFLILLTNTADPIASRFSIALVVLCIALYGAVKGIETLSRTAICVFALFLLGFAVIFIALFPHINTRYPEPVFQRGAEQFLRGSFVLAARCTTLSEFAVLMPFVIAPKRRGFAVWNTGITVFFGVLLFFTVSCLGEYAYLQIFPMYSLASVAEIAGVQRLDALFIGLWAMALVVRIACGFFAISECFARAVRKTESRVVLLSVAAVAALMAAVWVTADYERFRETFRTEYLFAFTILTGVILPLFVAAVDRFRKRGATP